MLPYGEAEPRPRRSLEFFLLAALSAAGTVLARNEDVVRAYGFVPDRPTAYTWVTSQFLHGGWLHFAGNFWFLWIFGPTVAAAIGPLFLPFFLMGGAFANMLLYAVEPSSAVPAIGASGAICAVMGYYAVVYPSARLKVLWEGVLQIRMSALFYILLFALLETIAALQASHGVLDGVAHSTHLGGLLFGAFVGLFAPADKLERESSGPRLEAPQESGPIAQDIDSGDDELAVQEYVAKVQADPGFRLDVRRELAMAAKLAEFEYGALAKSAIERLLESEPPPALRADAWLLLGEVEGSYFKDWPAALQAFKAAAGITEASAQTSTDARKGIAQAQATLERVLLDEARPSEPCMVFQRQTPGLDGAQRKAAAGILGQASRKQALADRPCAEAVALARELTAAGVPAVVIPERLLIPLPDPAVARSLAARPEGLTVDSGDVVPWRDCRLLSAYAVRKQTPAAKQEGIFDVDLEDTAVAGPSAVAELATAAYGAPNVGYMMAGDPAEYGGLSGLQPYLDVILGNPLRRLRWSPDPEDYDGGLIMQPFFAAIRVLLADEIEVPLTDGLVRAMNGRFARHHIFKDQSEADGYLFWQLQLARLRR